MRITDSIADAARRVRRFLTQDVWAVGLPGEKLSRNLLIQHVRVVVLLFRNLIKNTLLLRASALAFATLLSIVPFLALMFFVIETFNLDQELYAYLARTIGVLEVGKARSEPPEVESREDFRRAVAYFFLRITPEDMLREEAEEAKAQAAPQEPYPFVVNPITGESLVNPLDWHAPMALPDGEEPDGGGSSIFPHARNPVTGEWLENPIEIIVRYAKQGENPQNIGLVGVIFIITTVFGLMNNIESSFNQIWGIKDTRSWYRMISDYVMMVLILPFFVAGMISATAILKGVHLPLSEAIVYRLAQYAAIWFSFAAIYYFVPNTNVKMRYALLGGIVGGTLWNMLNWIYITFQYGLDRYSIFYSTLAQFPVLLMWVYFSWVILLFGAELAYAYQHEKVFVLERLAGKASHAYREALGVRTMVELARRFREGHGGLDPNAAALEWNVPLRLLNEVLYDFEQARLVVRLATLPTTYLPARPLDRITVADVVAVLREAGVDPTPLRLDPQYQALFKRLALGNGALATSLSDLAIEAGLPLPPESQLEYKPPVEETDEPEATEPEEKE